MTVPDPVASPGPGPSSVPPLTIRVHAEPLAVVRRDPGADLPPWAARPRGPLHVIARSAGETSVVTLDAAVPEAEPAERDFRGLEVVGPLDFALTGILARLTASLAEAGVPVFAVSTFDTDWLLVREAGRTAAEAALRGAGVDVQPHHPGA